MVTQYKSKLFLVSLLSTLAVMPVIASEKVDFWEELRLSQDLKKEAIKHFHQAKENEGIAIARKGICNMTDLFLVALKSKNPQLISPWIKHPWYNAAYHNLIKRLKDAKNLQGANDLQIQEANDLQIRLTKMHM